MRFWLPIVLWSDLGASQNEASSLDVSAHDVDGRMCVLGRNCGEAPNGMAAPYRND